MSDTATEIEQGDVVNAKIPVSMGTGIPALRTVRGLKVVKIGDYVSLVELSALESFFPGLSKNAALRMLKMFEVPIIYIGKYGYFNMYAFEQVLYYLTQPSRRSMALPGSKKKNQIFKKRSTKIPVTEHVALELNMEERAYIKKLETANKPPKPRVRKKSNSKKKVC